MSPRTLVSCTAVAIVSLLAALTVDACASSRPAVVADPTAGGIRVSKPLYGVSVLSSGRGYRAARLAAGRRYGGLPVVRYFDPGAPNPWRTLHRDVGHRPVVVSFKTNPSEVISGRDDGKFLHWFRHAPRKRITWWSYLPEPEADIAHGAYSKDDYRKAWARLAALALQAHNPNLRSTLVLMCYTLSPYSGRNWQDYYAGSNSIDVLGWDCYNDKAKYGVYEHPHDIFHRAVHLSRKLHKPWGVAETGSPLLGSDRGGKRANWLRHLGTYAARHHAQFVTYFDINWARANYRLNDPSSVAAWRAVIQRHDG